MEIIIVAGEEKGAKSGKRKEKRRIYPGTGSDGVLMCLSANENDAKETDVDLALRQR